MSGHLRKLRACAWLLNRKSELWIVRSNLVRQWNTSWDAKICFSIRENGRKRYNFEPFFLFLIILIILNDSLLFFRLFGSVHRQRASPRQPGNLQQHRIYLPASRKNLKHFHDSSHPSSIRSTTLLRWREYARERSDRLFLSRHFRCSQNNVFSWIYERLQLYDDKCFSSSQSWWSVCARASLPTLRADRRQSKGLLHFKQVNMAF